MGAPLEFAADPDLMSNAESLDHFFRFADERADHSLG